MPFYDIIFDNANWTTVLLAVAVFLAAYFFIQWSQWSPGPVGLPYLGYYPFLSNKNLHKELKELTRKYGDVFCFTITGQTYVHLGSFKSMREALVTKADCFMRKPKSFNLIMDTVKEGVVYASGEEWKVLRRFFSQKLKDYGMGKSTQETWLADSLQRTVDALKESGGKDFNILEFLTASGTLAASQLLFGPTGDEEVAKRLAEAFAYIMFFIFQKRMLLAGPLLKYVLMYVHPEMRSYRKWKKVMDSILGKILREHEKDFDKNSIRNLVDCFIAEKRQLQEKGDPRWKVYTETAFVDTLIQLMGDAATTIPNLAATVIKTLADRPEVQKRIQSEVDEVVGRDRFPTWDEKTRTPYTNAVIYEIIRTTEFFNFFPSLECTEETTVGGCRVPKGSILLPNYYSALHDERVYPDPQKFDPMRFLPGEDKKIKTELPQIFGMGKRSCLGESLTTMETYLFVTTIMQNFDLSPSPRPEEKTATQWKVEIRAVARKP